MQCIYHYNKEKNNMKLTKSQLKRIIKEELKAAISEPGQQHDFAQAYADIAAQQKQDRADAGGYEAQQKQKIAAKQKDMFAMIANFMKNGAAAADQRDPWFQNPLDPETAQLPKDAKAIANIISDAFDTIEAASGRYGSDRFGDFSAPPTVEDEGQRVTFTVKGQFDRPEMGYNVVNKEGGGIEIKPKPERDYRISGRL